MISRTLLAGLAAVIVLLPASSLGAQVSMAKQSGSQNLRVCPLTTSRTQFECFAEVRASESGQPLVQSANPDTAPPGYGPTQFHAAYNLPTTASTGQTIAIVDAYQNPNVYSDLQVYDTKFGLPSFPLCSTSSQSSCLAILNEYGSSSPLPASNYGWATEISLDVQIAHAICQNCRINLFEANDNANSNLATAEDTAVSMGATVVSNSYGSFEEDCTESAYNHQHVAIVVSAGDDGYGIACPAAMNTVVSVGGTSLYLSGGSYGSEYVWWDGYEGTGSGCSTYNSPRSWQTAVSDWSDTGCGSGRAMNDVSADADPDTGAAEYDSYNYGGWVEIGGTSLAAPLIAAVYALGGQASSWAYPAQSVYQSPGSLHDVTSGSNAYSCAHYIQCNADTGYDLPTGMGTPKGLGAFGGPSASGPANDDFSSASIISGSSGTVTGTNVGATGENGEPLNTTGSDPINSVWYSWTAPANGAATIDTCGSGFDTTLGVYTGSAVSSLTQVTANDDDPSDICGLDSVVTFPAVGGTTYLVSVDGYDTDEGSVVLDWSIASNGPVNDNFANASQISGATGSTSGSNLNATSETNEPANTPGSVPINSTWYLWTAPQTGSVSVDTCGSDFDTTLGVYTGASVASLTLVAANDDDPLGTCGRKSRVVFLASLGETYYFSVDGYGTKEGDVALNWSLSGTDVTPPVVQYPTGTIISPQTMGSTARVTEAWSASDPSGIASYELQLKKGSGAWSDVSLPSPTATTVDVALTVGATYRFRARATDGAGNTSAWAPTSSAKLRLVQENAATVSYTGTWKRVALSGASGGDVKYATAAGATATLSFEGAAASFVTTVASSRGICQVWIDGSLAATIDTYSASTATQRIVYATPRLTYGSHTIQIKVTGTKRSASTSTRVDLDAFLTWP